MVVTSMNYLKSAKVKAVPDKTTSCGLIIYPNPTKSNATLVFSSAKVGEFTIQIVSA